MSYNLSSVTHSAMYSGKLFVKYLFERPEGCIGQHRKQEKGRGWGNEIGQNEKRVGNQSRGSL